MVWTLPASIIALGQQQRVPYDDAPAWQGQDGCTGDLTVGAARLREYMRRHFGGTYGGYRCRPNTARPSQTSMHGTGRALDVFPVVDGQHSFELGDRIANWLVANAEAIGVQLVIWNRILWNGSAPGEKWRPYTGPHSHADHLHVELTVDGSEARTRFFNSGMIDAPPTLEARGSSVVPVALLVLSGAAFWYLWKRKR